jgi:hypothetical protein
VGKTKRGKGSKIMAVADCAGLPLAVSVSSAAPHEVTLVETTLNTLFVSELPERLIGDRAYDSDPLDNRLHARGIEMIAPHRRNRKKPATQDGRPLRRYKRRCKIERLFLNHFQSCLCGNHPHNDPYSGSFLESVILRGIIWQSRKRSNPTAGNQWNRLPIAA